MLKLAIFLIFVCFLFAYHVNGTFDLILIGLLFFHSERMLVSAH